MLKQRRLALRLSQKELAELIGTPPNYTSSLESHKRTPSINMIFRLAEALTICPLELIKYFLCANCSKKNCEKC